MDALAGSLDRFGRTWNDYEVRGLQHLPRDRPVLLVLYHGLVPMDALYLVARLYRTEGLVVRTLAERLLFKLPLLAQWSRAAGAIPGEPGAALQLLQDGHTVMVSPGGAREAIAGRPDFYQVKWGDRVGFARLALDAGVALLPVFGENIEELYRAPLAHTAPIQQLYERTRLPLVPVMGLGPLPVPVKLRTWIGAPIVPLQGESPGHLRDRVRDALQALINEHQPARPRMLRALAQRVAP